jgi:hypothetical protein
MIRSALLAILVVFTGFGMLAEAADLPSSPRLKTHKIIKLLMPHKKAKSQRPKAVIFVPKQPKPKPKPQVVADNEPPSVTQPEDEADVAVATPAPEVSSGELELSWFLDSLVANADGPKGEGSASMEGNLIVAEPGYVSSPYMVIELSGHIVKTRATTVRVEVKIGNVKRSVKWTSDEVESGRFSVSLNAPMSAGQLPGYFPISAIALVSREGKQGAALVSLEKIRVRLGKVTQVATK